MLCTFLKPITVSRRSFFCLYGIRITYTVLPDISLLLCAMSLIPACLLWKHFKWYFVGSDFTFSRSYCCDGTSLSVTCRDNFFLSHFHITNFWFIEKKYYYQFLNIQPYISYYWISFCSYFSDTQGHPILSARYPNFLKKLHISFNSVSYFFQGYYRKY